MKANNHSRRQTSKNDDEGVSPVIAVILMVAITVVLAATVYVWVSGFASDEGGPENAQVRATGYDSDDNGAADFIRLTLVRGENAPYGIAALDFNVTDPDNHILAHNPSQTNQDILCVDISAADGAGNYDKVCSGDHFDGQESTADSWEVGSSLYVPCQKAGQHQLSLSLRGSAVMDERIKCDEAAQ